MGGHSVVSVALALKVAQEVAGRGFFAATSGLSLIVSPTLGPRDLGNRGGVVSDLFLRLCATRKQIHTIGCRGLGAGHGIAEAIIAVPIADATVAIHDEDSDAARARPSRSRMLANRKVHLSPRYDLLMDW